MAVREGPNRQALERSMGGLDQGGVPHSPLAAWHHYVRHYWFPLRYAFASLEKKTLVALQFTLHYDLC